MFFDSVEFTKRMGKKQSKGVRLENLKPAPVTLRPFVEFTDDELIAMPTGSVFVYDVETYENYWLVSFESLDNGKIVCFEKTPEHDFPVEKLRWLMFRFCTVGFNSNVYDMPMTFAACAGYSTQFLKMLSDRIISENLRPRDVEKEYNINIPFESINHIDLIEVAPLEASLKLYAGRLHAPYLQDLPFDPSRILSREEGNIIKHYNVNDLNNTVLLYKELLPQIKLRETLSKEYHQDLRSRSDAQIAEAVIVSELLRMNRSHIRKPNIPEGTTFKYEVPDFISFQTPALQAMLLTVSKVVFETDGGGAPMMPEQLASLDLTLGSSVYKMGMGGLHSKEKSAAHVADAETLLCDRDVASFYPRIILNQRLYPKHLGENFLVVYNGLVEKRLAAKKAKNTVIADALKITINGGFGKFGNKYSYIYSPHLMIQVTLTGQLSLLMLIEMIELAGIPVVSGNTDGIVIKCPKARYDDLNAVIALWEQITCFETEETRYSAIYSRDVNSYIAIKEKGDEKGRLLSDRLGCKVKGEYSEVGSALNSVLSKNPQSLICSDAVQALIVNGTPIADTINACKDIRRFVSVKRVRGGAEKDGVYLGKVVRFYYAEGMTGQIRYVTNGNAVGKSEGAKPLMDLPPSLPEDLKLSYYIAEAESILEDIGYSKKSTMPLFF